MRHDGRFCFRWRESGAGEPVLLLHGLMGKTDHWKTTLRALGSFCRPVALELPIFDPSLSEVSLPSLTEWVCRFLDAQRMPHAVVGGNSLGGHVALEMAVAHPDRVSGLILTGSSGLFERSFTRGVPHRPTSEWVREKMEEIFMTRRWSPRSGWRRSCVSSVLGTRDFGCSRLPAPPSTGTWGTACQRSTYPLALSGERRTGSHRQK